MRDKNVTKPNINELLDKTDKIGIFRFDAITQEIYWNDVLKEMYEVPKDFTPCLENVVDFINVAHEQNRLLQAHTEALEKGAHFELDHQIITKKGNLRHLWVFGQPVFKDGKCLFIQGASMNITDRKEVELELQRKNTMLGFAEQMTKILGIGNGIW